MTLLKLWWLLRGVPRRGFKIGIIKHEQHDTWTWTDAGYVYLYLYKHQYPEPPFNGEWGIILTTISIDQDHEKIRDRYYRAMLKLGFKE